MKFWFILEMNFRFFKFRMYILVASDLSALLGLFNISGGRFIFDFDFKGLFS